MQGNAATMSLLHRYKVWLKYLAWVEASSGVHIFPCDRLEFWGRAKLWTQPASKCRLVSYFLLKKRCLHNALAKYVGRAR